MYSINKIENNTILFLLLIMMLTCCQTRENKQMSEEEQTTEITMSLSHEDTIAVVNLVDSFMTHIKMKDYYKAAGILYKLDGTRTFDDIPELLSNKELSEMVDLLQQYPVQNYHIDYIVFKEAEDNEVKCIIELQEGHEINWHFKPVRYMGNWLLCMRSSQQNDK